ncbi:TerB family tellurite resistance protein [Marinovum sp. 2_MG-2023]|uniref:tellurite resistance TerB family protein n=1 Tax=unclassified Marinovum TaxID=2647166 RepID=UPI0026E1C6C7|nr:MULTISPECIES: TerB family tellurite resistance protein [unclassified Marinovum]MDO6729518.1 TerB family tellurite resistance protein [Marinovum sp. 2_MG-2023]MDO6780328.1 TerB family tellurite resistance protein [Marinovum sp. 1_MG-2023]
MPTLFDRLTRLFSGGEAPDQPLPELDAAHALGALLVRVAKADHVYLFEELEQIDRILAHRNGLKPVAAAKMRAECERLESEVPDTPEFVAKLRDHVDYQDRRLIAEALWAVVIADGIREEHEVALVELVEEMLGVTEAHSAEARAAAEVQT